MRGKRARAPGGEGEGGGKKGKARKSANGAGAKPGERPTTVRPEDPHGAQRGGRSRTKGRPATERAETETKGTPGQKRPPYTSGGAREEEPIAEAGPTSDVHFLTL